MHFILNLRIKICIFSVFYLHLMVKVWIVTGSEAAPGVVTLAASLNPFPALPAAPVPSVGLPLPPQTLPPLPPPSSNNNCQLLPTFNEVFRFVMVLLTFRARARLIPLNRKGERHRGTMFAVWKACQGIWESLEAPPYPFTASFIVGSGSGWLSCQAK